MNALQLLRSLPLFTGLSELDLVTLSESLVPRTLKAGEVIFNKDDEGSAMFFVQSGDINIYLPRDLGRRVSLKDIGRGDFFGELALFDGLPRSASAVATSDTCVFELQRDALESYIEQRPQAAIAILRTMSARLRETNSLLDNRAAKNIDAEYDRNRTWSDRLSDTVAELNGSWKFIMLLLFLTATWCAINTGLLITSPIDPYPFQFFNLTLAILVSLQGPLIVMSQNRQSIKDRARAETDFNVNIKNEVNIEALLRELSEFRAEAQRAFERK